MNSRRRDHAALRMRPAQQRLAGRDALGVQIEQRLVVELEGVRGERVAQVELELAARLRLHVHSGSKKRQARAAVGLGAVERHVGVLEQQVGVAAVARRQRDADAGADHHLVAARSRRSRPGSATMRSASAPASFGLAERVLQHHELVAAEAGDDVGAAHQRAQPVGDRAQQRVAARMAERVVDLLELVEVDEQDGERPAASQARRRRRPSGRGKGAVRQAGQRVVARQLVDLGFGVRRSVMSSTSTTAPPSAIGWKVSASVRPSLGLDERARRRPRRRGRSRSPAQAVRVRRSTACRRVDAAAISSRARRRAAAMSATGRGARPAACWQTTRRRSASNMHRPCGMLLSAVSNRPRQQAHVAGGDHRIEQDAAQPVGDEFER